MSDKQLISSLPFNLSPKLVYTLLMAIIAWAITKWGVELDPNLSAGISLIIAGLVGYQVPAGDEIVSKGETTV